MVKPVSYTHLDVYKRQAVCIIYYYYGVIMCQTLYRTATQEQ